MDDQTLTTATKVCATLGAFVSTFLGAMKLWKTLWKDMVIFVTTHDFLEQESASDWVTVVDLYAHPVHVFWWTFVWKPDCFQLDTSAEDVTPDDSTGMFTIEPRARHTLNFNKSTKFDWSYRSARHRQLHLALHIFGHRRPLVLRVGTGQ